MKFHDDNLKTQMQLIFLKMEIFFIIKSELCNLLNLLRMI